jgi:Ran GTPase-activating protein (RanGAP) involved in mRNA processing and transport
MAAQEANAVSQRIFTDEAVTLDTSKVDETVVRGVAEALRDPNAVLEGFTIICSHLSMQCAEAVGDSLRANTSIREIRFSRINRSEILDVLLAGVGSNQSIHNLIVDSCEDKCNPLGAQGTVALVAAFRENASLEKLFISATQLGKEGTTVLANNLADGARSLARLKNLRLFRCDISSSEAADIARGLETNTALEVLKLESNPIGDEGAQALANALAQGKNKTLKNLYLRSCGITPAGEAPLAAMLETNDSLDSLTLLD